MDVHRLPSFIKRLAHRARNNAFLIGLLCLIWFALRTGTKPSRANYPCQRVAAVNGYVWLAAYVLPVLSVVQPRISISPRRKKLIIAGVALAIVVSASWLTINELGRETPQNQPEGFTVKGRLAEFEPASDIFVVSNTNGKDGGVAELVDLMGRQGLLFYKSPRTGKNQGPTGLIAANDVVIIKVNSQWDERGGTNTDLLRSLIQAIVDHPDGFTGEIVVADNGQAQYGSTGRGGSLNYGKNNAEDTSQSVQKVVDSFADSHRVSTYLWDTITTKLVREYSEGSAEDGYIVDTNESPRTGAMAAYPKFKTRFDTCISFKMGVWNPQTQTYDGERLKVINVPVLKSHSGYGVTAAVKHYMGVTSDKLTAQLGAQAHYTIGSGGMGTEMVETRFPTLNIIDAIWVNAQPGRGPSTPYNVAIRANVIAASTDPVALDYWASKHVLLQIARLKDYSGSSLFDPDNTASGSFGHWLRLSMQEMIRAGYKATMDESHMNVYVLDLRG